MEGEQPEVTTPSTTETPVQKTTDWEAGYKGLQANYNRLHQASAAKDEQLTTLSGQVEEMKRQLQEMSGQRDATRTASEQLQASLTELTGKYTDTQAQLDLYRMIADVPEFRNLAAIAGTLQPKESAEATREMLAGMAQAIGTLVQESVAREMNGVLPTGNLSRSGGGQPTPDELFNLAMQKAGTPEAGAALDAYYAALSAANTKVAAPKPGAWSDISG